MAWFFAASATLMLLIGVGNLFFGLDRAWSSLFMIPLGSLNLIWAVTSLRNKRGTRPAAE
ncbi:hypothetical protein C8046_03035 [Serinibacter arcticus]|uniref:Uncharacterized protein n=1 Tax=Serinibacter arcticus TaxID=1655435 RepID=A0A2U1ZS56_9MICO|nr:hypothetical protein C8046_03035 [Serinibacter arcticus]